jgi:hypothetical protein
VNSLQPKEVKCEFRMVRPCLGSLSRFPYLLPRPRAASGSGQLSVAFRLPPQPSPPPRDPEYHDLRSIHFLPLPKPLDSAAGCCRVGLDGSFTFSATLFLTTDRLQHTPVLLYHDDDPSLIKHLTRHPTGLPFLGLPPGASARLFRRHSPQ